MSEVEAGSHGAPAAAVVEDVADPGPMVEGEVDGNERPEATIPAFDADHNGDASPEATVPGIDDEAGDGDAGTESTMPGFDDDGDGDPSATPPGGPQPAKGAHPVLSWVVVLVVAALCAIGLRSFVVQTFFVPSSSMYPTLQIGDRILVQKIGYSIHRGDIVVFRRPPGDVNDPEDEDLVKRVIGLPGEWISSKGNTVYINGKPLSEPYLPRGTVLGKPIPRQKIPANDYFMLGDNRSDSLDSRYWGYLPSSYIVGRVFVVVWRGGHPVFHIQ